MTVTTFLVNARATLLAERTPGGFWVGELSTSALSTATATFALSLYRQAYPTAGAKYDALIRGGLRWLADHQNADGGWGDTTKSFSNISTTCLCWAAVAVPEATDLTAVAERAEAWIHNEAGTLDPKPLAKTIADRYGKDRTFSVPILTMLALAGRLGGDPWKLVPQLPFELAALPFWCFQTVQLPVVSYALPALIAIGQVKHARRPTWNPVARFFRWLTTRETLRKLREIQPTTGGYLEAAPLTSFVAMSLIGAGQSNHEVVTHALRFLAGNVRPDGSWPIDTNLSTWVTTLAINSLSPGGEGFGVRDLSPSPLTPLPPGEGGTSEDTIPFPQGEGGTSEDTIPFPQGEGGTKQWLLAQQYRTVHQYTQAAPGGWAWTNLSGGVPDADDTPGALLALAKFGEPDVATLSAVAAGVTWLLDLQNADGGIPTFCKGWTGLPFDRSSNDLTAHTLRAWAAWRPHLTPRLERRIDAGTKAGLTYLLKTQRPDGAWEPLWFGNQHAAEVANLTYGTSRVLLLADVSGLSDGVLSALRRGAEYLVRSQNADGGWGGRAGTPSSIEETALAVEGLLASSPPPLAGGGFGGQAIAATSGVEFLKVATEMGTHFPPSPIGFYFANLWYFEKLYPVVYTVAALTRFANLKGLAVPPT